MFGYKLSKGNYMLTLASVYGIDLSLTASELRFRSCKHEIESSHADISRSQDA